MPKVNVYAEIVYIVNVSIHKHYLFMKPHTNIPYGKHCSIHNMCACVGYMTPCKFLSDSLHSEKLLFSISTTQSWHPCSSVHNDTNATCCFFLSHHRRHRTYQQGQRIIIYEFCKVNLRSEFKPCSMRNFQRLQLLF